LPRPVVSVDNNTQLKSPATIISLSVDGSRDVMSVL
jgi:hypothetical protein